jgi:hypothetical protein
MLAVQKKRYLLLQLMLKLMPPFTGQVQNIGIIPNYIARSK